MISIKYHHTVRMAYVFNGYVLASFIVAISTIVVFLLPHLHDEPLGGFRLFGISPSHLEVSSCSDTYLTVTTVFHINRETKKLLAEEISPKYSKFNYVFLAKCYKDLGQRSHARQMCDAASAMSIVIKEDEEAQKELDSLVASL